MKTSIQKSHKPFHHFDGSIFMVTAGTYKGKMYFDTNEKKKMLQSIISEKANKYAIKLIAYAILGNHYHILVKAEKGEKIPYFIKDINGKSAYALNMLCGNLQERIWYNYWDSCVRTEDDFWKHFNYIHQNPVKHRYADALEDYEFSSYGVWVGKRGVEWMNNAFESYPIKDFTVKGDR